MMGMGMTRSDEHGHQEGAAFRMPPLGIGTLMIRKGVVGKVVKEAIRTGYRLIDCAPSYRNEREIGQALQELITAKEIQREELFVVSKIFNTHHVSEGEDRPRESLLQTLQELQLEQLDLLLMHWPYGIPDKEQRLRDKKGRLNPNLKIVEEYLDTWKSMEGLQQEGLVKHIGVSNFTKAQMDKLLQAGLSKPTVNQVELHPYLQQPDLVQYCQEHGIQLMAYSPLGGASKASNSFPPDIGSILLENPTILEIAKRHGGGKSVAQVLIRWSLQCGFVCIPKSANEVRIQENFQAMDGDWDLDQEAMHELASLDRCFRYSMGFVPEHFGGPSTA
jgi:alcohol dehydrogenase (NADP+)